MRRSEITEPDRRSSCCDRSSSLGWGEGEEEKRSKIKREIEREDKNERKE
jgi:hypothetical protein